MCSKKRVLVTEEIASSGIRLLEKSFEVDYRTELSRKEKVHDLIEAVKHADGLIVRSATQVTESVILSGSNLKVIGRAGVGVDNIDLETATRKGIMVINAPASNSIAAAEHTMAMILALCRNLPVAVARLQRDGCWDRKSFKGIELYGKTLGVLGLGRIGKLVAERARAFKMRVVAYDSVVSAEMAQRIGIEMMNSVEGVIEASDFITVHLPLNDNTRGLISSREFEIMKPAARIVNVARGGIIDETALYEALKGGQIAGAAMDVFKDEPCSESPLFELTNFIGTPHLGASTEEAQVKAGEVIAEQVASVLKGELVENVVNLDIPTVELDEEVMSFIPMSEKLGKIFTYLVGGKVEEIEIEYRGQLAKKPTEVLTVAAMKGFLEKTSEDPVSYVNAPILMKERGFSIAERKVEDSKDYVNLIMIRGKREDGIVAVGGTLVGPNNKERFVNIYDFGVDMPPSKYMVFFKYRDVPGMIGRIGTILGNNDINIDYIQVGMEKLSGEALCGLNVESPVSDEVMEEVLAEEQILEGKFIIL